MKIFNADCLTQMDKLINENIEVDAIICDIPYGTTSCKWDSVIPFDDMWDRLDKLIKPNGAIVLFGSEPFSSALRMSNIKNYKYDWIWHKNISGGFVLAKKQPMKYHENISVFYSCQPTYNPQYEEYSESMKKRYPKGGKKTDSKAIKNNIKNEIQGISRVEHAIDIKRGRYPQSVQYFKRPHTANSNSVHPTQKPIELMEYLIKTYTNENEIVLDFTMGSGTTGVACINTNREFIGIELDKNYFEIAENRIAEAKGEIGLFA